MTDLKIAVATNGPVPDNQCALKDAILFAASSELEMSADDVVAAAQAFYAFLQDPTDTGAPSAPAQAAQPAQPAQPQSSGEPAPSPAP